VYITKLHKVTHTVFCNIGISLCNKKLNNSCNISQFFAFYTFFNVSHLSLFKQQMSGTVFVRYGKYSYWRDW